MSFLKLTPTFLALAVLSRRTLRLELNRLTFMKHGWEELKLAYNGALTRLFAEGNSKICHPPHFRTVLRSSAI
jgi:hypothetical protein